MKFYSPRKVLLDVLICVSALTISISGRNIGYDVYKEIKGEEDFERKMKEADKVKKLTTDNNSIEFDKS